MSHFATEAKRQMDLRSMKSADLARAAKISEATLSNLFSGAKSKPNPHHLEKICLALSHKKLDHARLLASYLQDQRKGPGAELVEISILGENAALNEPPAPYLAPLVPKKEKMLEIIRMHPDDQDAWDVIAVIARSLERRE